MADHESLHYRAYTGSPNVIATVLDFGVGNIHSLVRALTGIGLCVKVSVDPRDALAGDVLVLPGVGAFPAAAGQLAESRTQLRVALADGLPCLAICLGMQLLLDESEEGRGEGIGLIEGRVTRLSGPRVPHVGWNTVATTSPLLSNALQMYFAHSYVCRPADPAVVAGWTESDGNRFPAVVRAARTTGVQFHPEKSGEAGRFFLRAWMEDVRRCA